MRRSTSAPTICVLFAVAILPSLPARPSPGRSAPAGGHSGLPVPETRLLADEVEVPFVVPESFPVPVVEVTVNGGGPWRLAVDTAMGGTVLFRRELAVEMGLPVVGQAMVGDSTVSGLKPADLVRIESMRLGQLEVRDILGLGFAAGQAHLEDIPDDIHGILGNQVYAELLTTLDYPARKLVFRRGELTAGDPAVVAFEEQGGVFVVETSIAGRTIPLFVDSGHRGTITLPESLAAELPLQGEMRKARAFSTVSHTYQRRVARLDGEVRVAATTLVDPELTFSDEHTPKLIGYGVLQHFAITIDRAHGLLRWDAAGRGTLEGITLER